MDYQCVFQWSVDGVWKVFRIIFNVFWKDFHGFGRIFNAFSMELRWMFNAFVKEFRFILDGFECISNGILMDFQRILERFSMHCLVLSIRTPFTPVTFGKPFYFARQMEWVLWGGAPASTSTSMPYERIGGAISTSVSMSYERFGLEIYLLLLCHSLSYLLLIRPQLRCQCHIRGMWWGFSFKVSRERRCLLSKPGSLVTDGVFYQSRGL